jgi:uncharacterized protein YecE (DUF72 family)
MAGRILCGTCGYDYPEWRSVFYPRGLPRGEFLSYYATQFAALEINSTFYRMPTEYQLRAMHSKSGGKLLFSVKAYRGLTHDIHTDWKNDAGLLKNALYPLMSDSVLAAVLFQFPQSFRYTPENRIYLDKLLAVFSEYPVVVEFRHTEWFSGRVFSGLDKRAAGLCLCDMPALKALPRFTPVVTGHTGYIRFHGRNAQNWYGCTGTAAVDRYRYCYTEAELRDTVPAICSLASRADQVFVFFNNHPDGAAAVNARVMQRITAQTDVPPFQ